MDFKLTLVTVVQKPKSEQKLGNGSPMMLWFSWFRLIMLWWSLFSLTWSLGGAASISSTLAHLTLILDGMHLFLISSSGAYKGRLLTEVSAGSFPFVPMVACATPFCFVAPGLLFPLDSVTPGLWFLSFVG